MIYPRILGAGQNAQDIDFHKLAPIRIEAKLKKQTTITGFPLFIFVKKYEKVCNFDSKESMTFIQNKPKN